jgi:hypothetical protein
MMCRTPAKPARQRTVMPAADDYQRGILLPHHLGQDDPRATRAWHQALLNRRWDLAAQLLGDEVADIRHEEIEDLR